MQSKVVFVLSVYCFISVFARPGNDVEEITVRGGTCIMLGAKCYQFVTVNKNWFEAYANCRRNRAHLLNVRDSNEMGLLSDYLLSNDLGNPGFWIDGNDLADEGTFLSTKTGNHLEFTRWRKGEPNNMHDVEHCVQLHKSDKVLMNDNWCKEKYFSICEHDLAGANEKYY